jgi:hypothetical protein
MIVCCEWVCHLMALNKACCESLTPARPFVLAPCLLAAHNDHCWEQTPSNSAAQKSPAPWTYPFEKDASAAALVVQEELVVAGRGASAADTCGRRQFSDGTLWAMHRCQSLGRPCRHSDLEPFHIKRKVQYPHLTVCLV